MSQQIRLRFSVRGFGHALFYFRGVYCELQRIYEIIAESNNGDTDLKLNRATDDIEVELRRGTCYVYLQDRDFKGFF